MYERFAGTVYLAAAVPLPMKGAWKLKHTANGQTVETVVTDYEAAELGNSTMWYQWSKAVKRLWLSQTGQA